MDNRNTHGHPSSGRSNQICHPDFAKDRFAACSHVMQQERLAARYIVCAAQLVCYIEDADSPQWTIQRMADQTETSAQAGCAIRTVAATAE